MRSRIFLSALLIIGAAFTLLIAPLSVRAADSSREPQVVIAIDVTGHSCFKKVARSLYALHTLAKPQPCPAGTVIQSVVVPLYQAVEVHEAYVLLPSGPTSQLTWNSVNKQIHELEEAKRATIQRSSRGKLAPKNDCGEYMEFGSGGNPYGDSIQWEIDYQESYSCNSVILDTAQLWGFTSPTALYWYEWLYASDGYRYGPPDCIFIGTNHISRTINRVDPNWYDFVWGLAVYQCKLLTTVNESIGPLG